jgi:hypothetical protein
LDEQYYERGRPDNRLGEDIFPRSATGNTQHYKENEQQDGRQAIFASQANVDTRKSHQAALHRSIYNEKRLRAGHSRGWSRLVTSAGMIGRPVFEVIDAAVAAIALARLPADACVRLRNIPSRPILLPHLPQKRPGAKGSYPALASKYTLS